MADGPELSPSAIGPEPGLTAPSSASKAKVWFTFQDERGTQWRVYDHVKRERGYAPAPLGSRHATHRGFVVIGKYPQALRFAFDGRDPDEHDLDPHRLGMQLYLATRVPPRRRDASPAPPPPSRP